MAKERADVLLVNMGLVDNRTKAKALILAGKVFLNEMRIEKAGQLIDDTKKPYIKEKEHPWVSRGGMKLAHAIEQFQINVKDKTIIDLGSSTGGFTDVLLTNGAKKIYAVDVGHGLLDWSLRQNPKISLLERTNARYLTAEQIPENIDGIVCDASFISLKKILPNSMALIENQSSQKPAFIIALIKPQFEAGREHIGKGGIVRDGSIHKMICDDISSWFDKMENWKVRDIIESPITGTKGNKEFLIFVEYLTFNDEITKK